VLASLKEICVNRAARLLSTETALRSTRCISSLDAKRSEIRRNVWAVGEVSLDLRASIQWQLRFSEFSASTWRARAPPANRVTNDSWVYVTSGRECFWEKLPYRLSPKLGNIVPGVLTPVVAMIHGFSMAWHSQVSSGSARAPEPSSGSGVIDFRSDASELPAIVMRLHLFLKARTTLKGSNNQIYSF
jgi:hypothetical protein